MANAIEAATFFSRSFWDAARPFVLDIGPEVRVFHVADRCDFDPMLKNVDFLPEAVLGRIATPSFLAAARCPALMRYILFNDL